MKILYKPDTGDIYHAVEDANWLYFSYSDAENYTVGEIADTEDNRFDRLAVLQFAGRFNKQNQTRFYVDLSTTPLVIKERKSWTEFYPEPGV